MCHSFTKLLTRVYNMKRRVELGDFPFLQKRNDESMRFLFLLKQNLLNKWDMHQDVVQKDNRSSLWVE